MSSLAWLACDARDVPRTESWLSPAERLLLAGLRFPRRRAAWRLGRWTAKHALTAYLGLPPGPRSLAALEVHARWRGAPLPYHGARALRCALSLSHRDGLGLAVVGGTDAAVGCDVERIEPRSAPMLEQFYSAGERRAIAADPEPSRAAALLWSAKEAALKALGVGLALDTREVLVQAEPGTRESTWHRLRVRVPGEAAPLEGWWTQRGARIWTLVGTDPTAAPRPLQDAWRANASERIR